MTDTLSVYRNVEHNLNQLVGGFASNVIYSDPSNHICPKARTMIYASSAIGTMPVPKT